jgi:hypothetical protein
MAPSWLSGSKGSTSVDDLIARKKYAQAVELLRGEFKAGRRDPRVRLQLADVLVLAGRGREAVPILMGLADEFARDGFAAKAISVLKKVQKIEPRRPDVDRQLAALIKQKRDLPPLGSSGTAPAELGFEEIGLSVAAPAPASAAAAPKTERIEPPGLAEFEEAAAILALEKQPAAEAGATAAPIDLSSLGDDLLSVIQNVLEDTAPSARPSGAPEAARSPLFGDFSEEELVAVIGGLQLRTWEPGDVLITEGEPGDSLFVLTGGVVKAFVRNAAGRNALVREMGEGDFFGEVSILRGIPRTATVTAAGRVEALELDRATLDSISATHPGVPSVLQRFYDQRFGSSAEVSARKRGG